MELPEDIEEKISSYLNLEFGESAIEASQLIYLGSSNSVFYWHFPSTDNKCWATVEPFEDSFLISLTTNEPTFN